MELGGVGDKGNNRKSSVNGKEMTCGCITCKKESRGNGGIEGSCSEAQATEKEDEGAL